MNFPQNKKSRKQMRLLNFKRSLADSNRCRSFCRALPSHSAKGPNTISDFRIIDFRFSAAKIGKIIYQITKFFSEIGQLN